MVRFAMRSASVSRSATPADYIVSRYRGGDVRARRSCLAVPGSEPRFHAKANESAADEIFLDLEDSVAPAAKAEARAAVVRALNTIPYEHKTRAVPVNGIETEWHEDDVTAVVSEAGARIDCLMIPKVE